MPAWVEKYTGKKLNFEFTSGGEFPDDPTGYDLVIHCGGCMLQPRVVQYREQLAEEAGVPFTNYGILIAYMNGILQRSLSIFPDLFER